MNFIEQIFSVNLDGGSGLCELALLLVVCAGVGLAILWRMNKRLVPASKWLWF